MKLQTALLASSICDVLATHRCVCYCRPARHPCLKDSLSVSKISLFPESVWSPSQWCEGSEAGSSAGASEVKWGCKEKSSAGRKRSANHLDKLHFLYNCFLKISFVTFVLKCWRCRISAVLFPCTSTSCCLVAHQMVSHWAEFMVLFLKQQQLESVAYSDSPGNFPEKHILNERHIQLVLGISVSFKVAN